MFPTRAKSKIAKTLAYPLKAKIISQALADVPQSDELKLWFSNYDTPTKLRQRTEFRLIEIAYSHREVDQFTAHYMEESGHNDPKWAITVYAVPIEIRARVMQLLQEEALPKIRAWLHEKAGVDNLRSCRIEISYDETADELGYFRHNSL